MTASTTATHASAGTISHDPLCQHRSLVSFADTLVGQSSPASRYVFHSSSTPNNSFEKTPSGRATFFKHDLSETTDSIAARASDLGLKSGGSFMALAASGLPARSPSELPPNWQVHQRLGSNSFLRGPPFARKTCRPLVLLLDSCLIIHAWQRPP